jgi:hypothetical protein
MGLEGRKSKRWNGFVFIYEMASRDHTQRHEFHGEEIRETWVLGAIF